MHIRILKALADESRLRILNLLYEGELCVCDIESTLKISQTNVSRHLACLKNAGLISSRKQAQWVYYSFNKSKELKFIDEFIDNVLRIKKEYKIDLINLKKATNCNCETTSKK